MTSETRVDVLAVIDQQLEFSIASDYPGASDDHRGLLAARAAVAELIETSSKLSAAISFPTYDSRCEMHCRLIDALSRIAGEA